MILNKKTRLTYFFVCNLYRIAQHKKKIERNANRYGTFQSCTNPSNVLSAFYEFADTCTYICTA